MHLKMSSAKWRPFFHGLNVLTWKQPHGYFMVKLKSFQYVRPMYIKFNSLAPERYGCGLTHWGRVTHICVDKLTIIVSDNGLSPGRHQAIIWNNVGILLIGPLGTNSSEILIGIRTFWFKKICLKMSSGKWRPFSLGLNVLNQWFSNSIQGLISGLPVKLHIDECHKISLLISQTWFKKWPGVIKQQAITWANVDWVLCHHVASPGHNELTYQFVSKFQCHQSKLLRFSCRLNCAFLKFIAIWWPGFYH